MTIDSIFPTPCKLLAALLIFAIAPLRADAQEDAENRIGIAPPGSKTLDGELVIRQRLERFFKSVNEKEVKTAYEDLLRGSKIGENTDNVTGLVDRTQKVLDLYGTMAEFELIRTERIGSRLVRFVYFTYGEAFPLQWEFYCYRSPNEEWQLLDITVNNDLDLMFGDKGSGKTRPAE